MPAAWSFPLRKTGEGRNRLPPDCARSARLRDCWRWPIEIRKARVGNHEDAHSARPGCCVHKECPDRFPERVRDGAAILECLRLPRPFENVAVPPRPWQGWTIRQRKQSGCLRKRLLAGQKVQVRSRKSGPCLSPLVPRMGPARFRGPAERPSDERLWIAPEQRWQTKASAKKQGYASRYPPVPPALLGETHETEFSLVGWQGIHASHKESSI